MSEPGTSSAGRPLDEQAAEWFARMRGPDANDHRAAFDSWLKEPQNRTAYNSIAESFSLGRLMIDDGARRRRRLAAAGAALLLALVSGTWLELRRDAPGGGPRDSLDQALARRATGRALLATAAGQTRPVRLTDGSLLILAADTRIAANFSDTLRRLTLERGQARFQVAHERRPFVVYAGGGWVTARGTTFEVALRPGHRVSVHLVEGVVEVTAPEAGPSGQPRQRRLHAGETIGFAAIEKEPMQSLDATRNGVAEAPAQSQPQAQEFEDVSLARLIDLANRTSRLPIRLADPSLGSRRVSGRFRINDTELLAQRLAALFDLSVERGEPGAILLRPN